jgi:hypothetical protein
MNLVNSLMTGFFDVFLTPFELLGTEIALLLVSGVIGIVCLIIFKQISWQSGIKGVKNKIKGNIIAIRLYQDDLVIVGKAVGSVVLRNFQYLGLNFGPILPLLIPFVLVLSQLVVRYAYDPVPVSTEQEIAQMMSGDGTMVVIELKSEYASEASSLTVEFPDGIRAISPIVRSASEGRAFVEIAATKAVSGEITVLIDGVVVGVKEIVTGDQPERRMQPRRSSSFWAAWLLPAEDGFGDDSKLASIGFTYPDRQLAMLPGGELGIVLIFFIASMAFGVAVLKPLNIQI